MYLLERSPLALSPAEQKQALIHLIRKLAYREGKFTLSSGQTASFYINCKPVTLHPQGAYLVGQLLLSALPEDTQAVAGLTLGADPIVTAVSLASVYREGAFREGSHLNNLPAIIVRKQAKGHGTEAWLEGPELSPGSRVWILEDVVTTGASALVAAERIAAAGYVVGGVLTLVDRQEGGAELYEKEGIAFRSLLTIADIRHAA